MENLSQLWIFLKIQLINSPQNLQTFTEENFWCYTLMLLRTIYGGGPFFLEVEYLVNLITCWSLEIITWNIMINCHHKTQYCQTKSSTVSLVVLYTCSLPWWITRTLFCKTYYTLYLLLCFCLFIRFSRKRKRQIEDYDGYKKELKMRMMKCMWCCWYTVYLHT